MSSVRTKTIMIAPEGVEESIIEGQPYFVMEGDDGVGRIEVYNATHIPILIRHGYTTEREETMVRPGVQAGAGPIDVDELGRGGLQDALRERGVSFPPDASRVALADIADAWNMARSRRGRGTGQAAADARPATPAPAAAPAASTPAPAPLTKAVEEDFGSLSYDDLKGWLVGHGVAFPANPKKADLIRMCQETLAAQAPKAAAAS